VHIWSPLGIQAETGSPQQGLFYLSIYGSISTAVPKFWLQVPNQVLSRRVHDHEKHTLVTAAITYPRATPSSETIEMFEYNSSFLVVGKTASQNYPAAWMHFIRFPG